MRQNVLICLTALISTACTPLIGNTPNIDASIRGSDPLAGLSFKPVSQSTAQLLDGSKGSAGTGAATPAVAPMPAMAPSLGCSSPPYYSYGAYGFNEQMSLVSLFEAEAAGYAGSSFQEMLKSIIAPIIKDWSNDARLISTTGSLESDSTTWNLSYISKKRNETLDFSVAKSKTSVIRKAWAPLEILPEKITVDSGAALKLVQDAICNKDTKSEEERTGVDYFFKTALSPTNQGTQVEVLYRLPTDAHWNISLQSILGHTVWQIDGYAMSTPVPTPTPVADGSANTATVCSINEYSQGMIDAESGVLIRLTRPCKYTYTNSGDTEIIPPVPPTVAK